MKARLNLPGTAHGTTIQSRIADTIADRVQLNRVTIIVGPTGSGKSTKVPPLILDRVGGPILCTQPRRLAVVAIAKRVANERGTALGDSDVGYHVGNCNMSTHKTKLLFTTAGILLEELRANGFEALTKFCCCVIDECHERSPESDLVLSLIKQFMISKPKAKIRVVLMSATFDHARYAKYFQGVPGCNHIDTITLETANSFESFYSQVTTFYLEDVAKIIPDAMGYAEYFQKMKKDSNMDLRHDEGRSLSSSLVSLVGSLTFVLDTQEPKSSPFLIFAPTYRHLDQLFYELSKLPSLHLSVLHSSIDIEDCLWSINKASRNPHKRYVFLASAIADSSITVPDVSCVIDLCRTLEVKWNTKSRSHAATTVWASHSICDQRRGRTGRTCAGRVFRLIPKGFFVTKMRQWDIAQLSLSSCHNETIAIVCSSHNLAQDPRKVLNTCLDPPKAIVLTDAIKYLIEIGACIEMKNGLSFLLSPSKMQERDTSLVQATSYGALLGSLPVTVSEARAIIAGGTIGMLHEALILQAISSLKPLPITQHFGEENQAKNKSALQKYYPEVDPNDPGSVAIAHLSAYFYWDLAWSLHRRRIIVQRSQSSLLGGRHKPPSLLPWTPELEEEHTEWCRKHSINPTSVRSISDMIDSCYATFHLARFEPEWLQCVDPTPIWKRPGDWDSEYALHRFGMIFRVYGANADIMCQVLKAMFASKGDMSNVLPIIQMLPHINLDPCYKQSAPKPKEACVHFLMGNCKFGSKCRASHSPNAPRPMCRFYESGNCAKGDKCIYSHGQENKNKGNTTNSKLDVHNPLLSVLPIVDDYTVYDGNPLQWYKKNRSKLLMLGEGNFKFTSVLAQLGTPPAYASTLENSVYRGPCTIVSNVNATSLHADERIVYDLVAQNKVTAFAWNFPFTGQEEDTTAHEVLMQQMFQSLALIIHTLCEEGVIVPSLKFALSLQGDQFSRWNVRRAALQAGVRLSGWCEFDESDFPGYFPSRANGEIFPATDKRFYTFIATFEDLEGIL